MGRTLVVGDVHGCLEQLDELLKLSEYDAQEDRLIFLGDLIDKGPDPVGVVRRVIELNAECILGNHEEKALRWLRHERIRRTTGKENPVKSYHQDQQWQKIDPVDEAWLCSLPLYIRPMPGWVLVHGGVASRTPVAEQGESVLRLRWVLPDGTAFKGNPFRPPPEARRWAAHYSGGENVVYGHAVYDLKEPTIDPAIAWPRGVLRPHCYGIDTGCVYGGCLTMMVLETKEFIQVQNPIEYQKWAGKGPSDET